MGAQNASGNTALHICALYNQDSCARVLLFRGGNKELKNYNSQTPFQVAIIAGNFELAEYIKNHKETDIVPLVPTRRTVSRAPPLSHRPAGGWARSCILEEPAGLFPPAPGLHRTCSGEQSDWTSSGELSKMAPSPRGGGRWGSKAPGEVAGWHLCLTACAPPPVFGDGGERNRVCLAVESSRVKFVADTRPASENRTRMQSQGLCLHQPAPCAEHRASGRLRPMLTPVPPLPPAMSQGKSLNCSEIHACTTAASARPCARIIEIDELTSAK
nr:PREDICTED: SH3 and multiple ankyrin repeat domains protein 1-like [Equus przewalskii]